ncbi:hypothetical protein L3i22_096740 [Actinoplanes sp. L3-i22]|nr:hypothetical protein L3i22_096740 [Actinoplanes sp. L3-i22]
MKPASVGCGFFRIPGPVPASVGAAAGWFLALMSAAAGPVLGAGWAELWGRFRASVGAAVGSVLGAGGRGCGGGHEAGRPIRGFGCGAAKVPLAAEAGGVRKALGPIV